MSIQVVLDLPLKKADLDEQTRSLIGSPPNKLAFSVVEIVRLPAPGTRVGGAKVGDSVQGKVVIHYVGPLSVRVVDDAIEKVQAPKKRPRKATKKRKLAPARKKGGSVPRPGKNGLPRRVKKTSSSVRQKE